jgi:hypothetical protein
MWPFGQSICFPNPAVSLTKNGYAELEGLLHAPA